MNQIFWLWDEVNRLRKAAGKALVPQSYIRGGRKVCRPFDPPRPGLDGEDDSATSPSRSIR